jgi:hypothetical protein
MEARVKPETCPKCGSIFVEWDRYQKVYRCLVKSCGWTSEYRNGLHPRLNSTETLDQLRKAEQTQPAISCYPNVSS